MRVLVLWADSVSSNLGLRALGAGVDTLIRRVWPDAQVVFHNFGSSGSPARVGSVRSAVKERITGRQGLVPWLTGFDLVMDTRSGDSFSDIYGLRRLATMSLMADAVHRAEVPLVLAPQTIGPFETRRGRLMARRALKQAAVVMVRDSRSARAAADLGTTADVTATDVVFALPTPARTGARDVLLNASGLLWADNPHVPSATYRQTVRGLIRALIEHDREVTLLAHVLDSRSADNDMVAVRALREEFPDLEVVVPADLWEVRSAAASARLTVGSRMHACLNSLSVGTAAVPLAYSRKFQPLLHDIGWQASVDLRTSIDPVGEVLGHLADEKAIREAATRSRATAQDLLTPVANALRLVG